MRDATEYQFSEGGRRVLVRSGAIDASLEDAARRYVVELETFLAASGVRVEDPGLTERGAKAIVVTGDLPSPNDAGDRKGASHVRTAFLHFGAGPLTELTAYAPADDTGAEAEFRRLVRTARPAGQADAARQVARAIEAGPIGQSHHPAGAIELALTSDYRAPESFMLASTDNAVHFFIDRATAEAAPTRGAAEGTILALGVGLGRDEQGQPVRYESGARPRLYARQGEAHAAPPAALATKGPESPARAVTPGEVILSGSVRGKPIRLSVTATAGEADGKRLGEELMQAMNRLD